MRKKSSKLKIVKAPRIAVSKPAEDSLIKEDGQKFDDSALFESFFDEYAAGDSDDIPSDADESVAVKGTDSYPSNEELCRIIQNEHDSRCELAKNAILIKNQSLVDKVVSKYQCYYHSGGKSYYRNPFWSCSSEIETDKNSEKYEDCRIDDKELIEKSHILGNRIKKSVTVKATTRKTTIKSLSRCDFFKIVQDKIDVIEDEEPDVSPVCDSTVQYEALDFEGNPITVNGFYKTKVDQDLEQCGLIALYKASLAYDASKGAMFSTYAQTAIEHAIQQEILDNGKIVKIPRSFSEKYIKYNDAFNKYFDPAAGNEEEAYKKAAKDLGIKAGEVMDELELRKRAENPISLNVMIEGEDAAMEAISNITYSDIPDIPEYKRYRTRIEREVKEELPIDVVVCNNISNVYRENAFTIVYSYGLHSTFYRAIHDSLDIKQKKIISGLYGFGNFRYTQKAVANKLTTDRRNLRKVRNDAIKELKESKDIDTIRELYDLYEEPFGKKPSMKCNNKSYEK